MNRPEDIEIHPKTNEVFICLSNNAKKLDFHGSILKISEDKNDPLKFKSATFLMGGKTLSCPDNIVFDSRGNLYVATDISGRRIGKYPYTDFENNGLFVVPAKAPMRDKLFKSPVLQMMLSLLGFIFQRMKKLFSCQSNTLENLVNQQAPLQAIGRQDLNLKFLAPQSYNFKARHFKTSTYFKFSLM